METITAEHVSFSYGYDASEERVLEDVSFTIHKGEFIAILGANGCGKSTLVKHLNAILPIQEGRVRVFGMDAGDENHLWELRRICGMVFQNPDNQFVSSVVEEDVAFGLENYEVPEDEIPDRIQEALQQVGMEGFEKRSPHTLSGGQKQRVAMAGVLAVKPEVLVLDEATAMLDPEGRAEVLRYLKKLHEQGITIIMITHYVEEAVWADQVLLMKEGKILKCGKPEIIVTDRKLMEKAGLLPPLPVRIYYDLCEKGMQLTNCPLTEDALVEEICRLN